MSDQDDLTHYMQAVSRMRVGFMTTETQKREICAKLADYWISAPELRLGQLLVNAAPDDLKSEVRLFYIPDEDLLAAVARFTCNL